MVTTAPPAAVPPVEDLAGLPRTFTVYFDRDSADIRASAMQVLWEASQAAGKLKPATIRVHGFTDAVGNAGHNRKLSERRAAAVAAQLVKLGLNVAVIDAKGQGVAKGKRTDSRNRRVELSFEGTAASAMTPLPGAAYRTGAETLSAAAPVLASAMAAPAAAAASVSPAVSGVVGETVQRPAAASVAEALRPVPCAAGPPPAADA